MSARIASIILGLVLVGVGVLGFFPNPLVSYDGLFAVDANHNFVHIATGVLLLVLPFIIGGKQSLLLMGAIYAIVAVLGFLTPGDMLLGLVHINQADRFLHVAVAAVILLAGLFLSNE